jgi:predicted signal transduction protein with EAL and GGDEF domain
MDDFGTGYSSLSYLRSFPFDKIKIDQSFVRDLGANPDAQAIVRSIISLGKGLGVIITAEGVETEAELSCLRAEGCHEGQGFLFSRARPHAEIERCCRRDGCASSPDADRSRTVGEPPADEIQVPASSSSALDAGVKKMNMLATTMVAARK